MPVCRKKEGYGLTLKGGSECFIKGGTLRNERGGRPATVTGLLHSLIIAQTNLGSFVCMV